MKKNIPLCILLASTLAACGGGGGAGGGSKQTCASFTYQEDAQAHYTKELDSDNDGIACESLPHRPVTTAAPIATPIATAIPTTTPTAVLSATGLWAARYISAVTDDLTLLNLPSGEYWSFYWINNKIAGFTQGNYSSVGSNVTSSNGFDFDVARLNKPDAMTFTGTVVPQTSLELKTVEMGISNTTKFNFHNNTFLKADVAAIAGSYTGKSYSKNYGSGVSEGFNLAANGKITSTSTACSYTGQLTAMPDANAYRFTVTFGAAPCDNAGETLTGVAIQSLISNQIVAAGLNGARNNAFLFVGAK